MQRYGSATLAADGDDDGAWLLTVSGLDASVLAFSDHADRLVAVVPTEVYADLVDGAEDPLNAMLVATAVGTSAETAAVVELFGARRDGGAGTIVFRVGVLAEAEGPNPPAPIAAGAEPTAFGAGHVFVDGSSGGGKAAKARAAVAYMGGMAAGGAAVARFKQHKDNPT